MAFNLNKVICISACALLFIPKLNIYSIPGQTAGIRIDDLLIAIITFIFIYKWISIGRFKINKHYFYFYLFVIFSFVSFIINKQIFEQVSIFYVLRPLEYFVFFIAGRLILDRILIVKLCLYLYIFQILIIFFQYLRVVPAFSSTDGIVYGYLSGTTGGPWEVVVVISLSSIVIFQYLLNDKKFFYSILLFAFTILIFLFIGQRFPIVALIITYYIMLNKANAINKSLLHLLSLLFMFMFMLFWSELGIFSAVQRMQKILSFDNINYLIYYYDFIDINSDKLPVGMVIPVNEVDLSWAMRIEKWSYAIKTFISELPVAFFFGIGPGWSGPSLDGGGIRLLVEHGVFGFTLFFLFLARIVRINLRSFYITIGFILNMVFIDVNIAYKIMSLYLLLMGYYSKEKYI